MSMTKPTAASERVAVSLKSLIDLAQPAALLNLHRHSRRAQQSGTYVSRFKGRGMEFEEARMYQPGDDIRSIDWRVTARTGKAHTKVFREERERPVFIAVDQRATMQFATRGVFKSVLAAKLAALLAWSAQHHGDRIGGQIFADHDCRELKPHNGKTGVLRFLNACVSGTSAAIATNKPTLPLDAALARLSQHARPGSLVYLISDFRGLNHQAEVHLAKLSQHCDVVLVFVYDPLEMHLPDKGRYRFTDSERDVVVDSSDQQRLLAYQQRFAERIGHVQNLAKKMQMAFLQCSTLDEPLRALTQR
ncbi:DUF58 domain-containing protein [Methylosoma difficile]